VLLLPHRDPGDRVGVHVVASVSERHALLQYGVGEAPLAALILEILPVVVGGHLGEAQPLVVVQGQLGGPVRRFVRTRVRVHERRLWSALATPGERLLAAAQRWNGPDVDGRATARSCAAMESARCRWESDCAQLPSDGIGPLSMGERLRAELPSDEIGPMSMGERLRAAAQRWNGPDVDGRATARRAAKR